jgi:hypothetical protein
MQGVSRTGGSNSLHLIRGNPSDTAPPITVAHKTPLIHPVVQKVVIEKEIRKLSRLVFGTNRNARIACNI